MLLGERPGRFDTSREGVVQIPRAPLLRYPTLKRHLLSVLRVLAGCSDERLPGPKPTPGRVLYTNARAYTLAHEAPWAGALLTSGAEIEFVGSEEDARALADDATRRVDLKGAFVLPGLIDTHTHPGLVGTLQEEEDESFAGQRLPTSSK